MKITLYRLTIKHTEPMPEGYGGDVVTYHQTSWHSVRAKVPGKNRTVVLVEEKTIELEDNCEKK